MTRLPRLKGKELIRILERAGFTVVRRKEVTRSFGIRTGGRPWCRFIPAKRLARVYCERSCATSN
jgi:hypothetical protein